MMKKNGFTIIEAIVALSILTIALIPIYLVALRSLDVAYSIRNNVTAANLAQEGAEVVRAIRDTSWFASSAFFAGAVPDGAYEVEWNSAVLANDQSRYLNLQANGLYTYTAGTATIFKRKITITNISNDDVRVESSVTWTERGRDKNITVESHLFNWR